MAVMFLYESSRRLLVWFSACFIRTFITPVEDQERKRERERDRVYTKLYDVIKSNNLKKTIFVTFHGHKK